MNGDEIVKYVAEETHVSFVQLEREFPQYFGGTQCISLTGLDTIILWTGFTEEGSALFLNLVNSKRLYFHPTQTLFAGKPAVYMIDGKCLMMPLAKQARQYKKLHWYPVVLNTFPYSPKKVKPCEGRLVSSGCRPRCPADPA